MTTLQNRRYDHRMTNSGTVDPQSLNSRGASTKRFNADRFVHIGFLIYILMVFTLTFSVSAAETEATDRGLLSGFRQRIDTYLNPVAPDILLPEDLSGGAVFISTKDGPAKAAVRMSGVENIYTLKALWNDKGEFMKILENRDGLGKAEYISRYGIGAAATRALPSGYTYQDDVDRAYLTEPDGYDTYKWEVSTDGVNYKDLSASSSISNREIVPEVSTKNRYYRCKAMIQGEEFVLGENYRIKFETLPRNTSLHVIEKTA